MVAHASWYSRGCCWKEDVRNTNARSGIKETKKKTFAMHQTRKVFNYWLEPHATATDGGRISSGPAC